MAPAVAPHTADHQHAVDYIEDRLGRLAFVDQYIARLQRTFGRLVEDVQEQVVTQLFRGHTSSIARQQRARKPRRTGAEGCQ